jgi:hypothetical protein
MRSYSAWSNLLNTLVRPDISSPSHSLPMWKIAKAIPSPIAANTNLPIARLRFSKLDRLFFDDLAPVRAEVLCANSSGTMSMSRDKGEDLAVSFAEFKSGLGAELVACLPPLEEEKPLDCGLPFTRTVVRKISVVKVRPQVRDKSMLAIQP